MMVPEGTGYTKKIGRWHVDLNTQTCDCPAYMGRLETARRIEDLHVEILLGTEVQQKLAQRQFNMLSPFPGVTCKHLLASLALANLISLKDEFMSFSDVIRIKAKAHFEAEKHAEEAILKTGQPEPRVVNLGHKAQSPGPLARAGDRGERVDRSQDPHPVGGHPGKERPPHEPGALRL